MPVNALNVEFSYVRTKSVDNKPINELQYAKHIDMRPGFFNSDYNFNFDDKRATLSQSTEASIKSNNLGSLSNIKSLLISLSGVSPLRQRVKIAGMTTLFVVFTFVLLTSLSHFFSHHIRLPFLHTKWASIATDTVPAFMMLSVIVICVINAIESNLQQKRELLLSIFLSKTFLLEMNNKQHNWTAVVSAVSDGSKSVPSVMEEYKVDFYHLFKYLMGDEAGINNQITQDDVANNMQFTHDELMAFVIFVLHEHTTTLDNLLLQFGYSMSDIDDISDTSKVKLLSNKFISGIASQQSKQMFEDITKALSKPEPYIDNSSSIKALMEDGELVNYLTNFAIDKVDWFKPGIRGASLSVDNSVVEDTPVKVRW